MQSKNVSRETFEKIEFFKNELLKWNKKINLISQGDEININTRHIDDSLQLAGYIDDLNCKIIDFGSGAGFPGLILSIIGYKNVTLVESDSKKCIFLEEIKQKLMLNTVILHKRIEDVDSNASYDIITARALSSISKLLEYSEKFLHNNIRLLFLKGKNIDQEINEAQINWSFSYKKHRSLIEETGFVIEIDGIRKKNEL